MDATAKTSIAACSGEQRPLEAADLALLETLRRQLVRGVVFLAVIALPFLGLLAFPALIFIDGSTSDLPVVLLFAAVGLAVLCFIGHTQSRNIAMLRGLYALRRHGAAGTKTVRRGELRALLDTDRAIRYDLGGEVSKVWLPIPHANAGGLEFRHAVTALEGLPHQRVELELFELRGAPAPVLLRAAYPGYPPMVSDRAATAQECAEMAAWDLGWVRWFGGILAFLTCLFGASLLGGWIGALVTMALGAAVLVRVLSQARRRVDSQPRMRIVTGLIAEVLDSPVAVGRMTEIRRWYRIGDRLYPTGLEAKDDGLVCGSVVRLHYLDRGLRGGRVLHIASLAGSHGASGESTGA